MTPERKQHLRSLDASETPYLLEALEALDDGERRRLREVHDAEAERDEALARAEAAETAAATDAEAERDEALARAEAAETAAATAWKRFWEMREAYTTNSRTYGGVVRERDEAQLVATGLATAVKEARAALGASDGEPLVEAAKRLVTAAERGREQAAKRTLGRSFVALALDGTLYALRRAAMTGTDAHLSSEAAGLVLGVVRAAMDRAVSDVSDGRSDAALATYEDDLDAVTKFAAGDDVRR